MAKVIGLILIILGLVVIASPFVFKAAIAKIPFVSALPQLWVIIAGAVLIVLGGLILKLKGGKQVKKEVPIYEGNKIIGYRRK